MNEVHLEHALLDVADLDRSLGFYRKLLPDWVIRWEGTGGDTGRWVHFGPSGDGQPGYLSLYETPGAKAGDDSGLRIEHIGFAHPDVAALVERLTAQTGDMTAVLAAEQLLMRELCANPHRGHACFH